MKNKLVLIVFIFSYSVGYTQTNLSGIVHYQSTISSKKLDEYLINKRKNKQEKKYTKMLDKVFLYTKPIKSTLTFSGGKGLFIVDDKLSIDTQNLGQRINKTLAGGSKEYYYNDKTKTYLIKDCESLGECFIFPNDFLKWQLTQESKTINGYTCYKATRAKGKVIAWYTPLLPVNFGPKGEYGLPGLILELEIEKIIFKATKIELNPKKKIKIKAPKGINVTSKEYEKMVKKGMKAIFGKKRKQ